MPPVTQVPWRLSGTHARLGLPAPGTGCSLCNTAASPVPPSLASGLRFSAGNVLKAHLKGTLRNRKSSLDRTGLRRVSAGALVPFPGLASVTLGFLGALCCLLPQRCPCPPSPLPPIVVKSLHAVLSRHLMNDLQFPKPVLAVCLIYSV